MTEDKLLDVTITFAPSAQSPNPSIIYNNVVHWEWDQMHGLRLQLEDDDTTICLNSTYVIGVVWKDELEPEQPELWDVDDDNSD